MRFGSVTYTQTLPSFLSECHLRDHYYLLVVPKFREIQYERVKKV